MKCILFGLIGLALGAIVTYVITEQGPEPKTCPKYDYTNAEAFPHIKSSTAHALADLYMNDSLAVAKKIKIGGNDSNADARSTCYSLPVLKKYIWELENKFCNQDSIDINNLAIRFYYGRYPDLTLNQYPELEGLPKNYSFRHMLFLVPALKDGDIFRDINPDHLNYVPQNPQLRSAQDEPENDYIMDMGNITPPPFQSSTPDGKTVYQTNGMAY